MSVESIQILHLEDDVGDGEYVAALLQSEGLNCEIERVDTGEEFCRRLVAQPPQLILSDFSMPSYDGLRALRLSRDVCPTVPFIFFSGTLGEENAVISLKDGATDYVLKQRPSRLVPAIQRALADVEERARRQEAEAKTREQAALLDEARDAICVQDLDRHILYWNKSAERVYGWSADEVLGREVSGLFMEDAAARAAFDEVLKTGTWQGELTQTNRKGDTLIVESRWSLIRENNGQPKSILAINTDVTEKKAIEAQYFRAQRLESIGLLAGGIAHDLNNILGPILMSCELLQKGDDPDAGTLLKGIATSTERGANLVKQILTFARGMDGEKISLDVRHVIQEVISLISSTFPRNITLHTDLPRNLPPIQGDATQLHQVILNLCVNARDAMPNGGVLKIKVAPVEFTARQTSIQAAPMSGSFVEIAVSDTGTGIPPSVIDKIFDPFFTTKDAGKGTGLGLSTVVGIVRGHGGSLEVASQLGRGTTFNLYFPVAAMASAALVAPPAEAPAPASGQCILCVDDEVSIRDLTRRILKGAGYRVLTANDGRAALDVFAEHREEIDLVITDISMPIMDGAAFIVAVRDLKPDLSIIVASGFLSTAQIPEEARYAPQARLQKPYSVASLLHSVRGVLAA